VSVGPHLASWHPWMSHSCASDVLIVSPNEVLLCVLLSYYYERREGRQRSAVHMGWISRSRGTANNSYVYILSILSLRGWEVVKYLAPR
jgi:hypothetical protein